MDKINERSHLRWKTKGHKGFTPLALGHAVEVAELAPNANLLLLLVCYRLKQPKALETAIGQWWTKCQPNLGQPKARE